MSKPGDSRIERAAACEGRFKLEGAVFTKLEDVNIEISRGSTSLTGEAHIPKLILLQ